MHVPSPLRLPSEETFAFEIYGGFDDDEFRLPPSLVPVWKPRARPAFGNNKAAKIQDDRSNGVPPIESDKTLTGSESFDDATPPPLSVSRGGHRKSGHVHDLAKYSTSCYEMSPEVSLPLPLETTYAQYDTDPDEMALSVLTEATRTRCFPEEMQEQPDVNVNNIDIDLNDMDVPISPAACGQDDRPTAIASASERIASQSVQPLTNAAFLDVDLVLPPNATFFTGDSWPALMPSASPWHLPTGPSLPQHCSASRFFEARNPQPSAHTQTSSAGSIEAAIRSSEKADVKQGKTAESPTEAHAVRGIVSGKKGKRKALDQFPTPSPTVRRACLSATKRSKSITSQDELEDSDGQQFGCHMDCIGELDEGEGACQFCGCMVGRTF